MKRFITLCLTLLPFLGIAQNQKIEKDENHYFTLGTDLAVEKYDFVSDTLKAGGEKIIGRKGAKFNLVRIIEDNNGAILRYVVKFWRYEELSQTYEKQIELIDEKINKADSVDNKEKLEEKKSDIELAKTKYEAQQALYVSDDNNDEYFFIQAKDFKEPYVIKTYYRGIYNLLPNIGTLIVPIKIRPSINDRPFDFTTDFTLGTSIGVKTRISKYRPNYLSLVGVFGVTTVNIDSSSTNGFVNEVTKQSAITPGIGLLVEIEGFQIGLIVGKDYIGGSTGENWAYNKKTWWSFGIGYEFVKEKDKK